MLRAQLQQIVVVVVVVAAADALKRNKTERDKPTQPPKVICRMEAQLEYIHIAYTFLHVWCRFVCSVGAY